MNKESLNESVMSIQNSKFDTQKVGSKSLHRTSLCFPSSPPTLFFPSYISYKYIVQIDVAISPKILLCGILKRIPKRMSCQIDLQL